MHLGKHKAAAALALTLSASALAVAAPTQAATDTIDYACTVGNNSFTLPMKWDSNASAQAFYGTPSATVFSGEGTLPGGVARSLHQDGGRSFSGSLDRGVTVHDVADQAGSALPVALSVARSDLGAQATATAVPVKVSSAAFTGGRSAPGKLTFKASGFTASLKVTQADGTVKDVSFGCTLPGAAPTIGATEWIARTTTAITLSETTAEYGEGVAVRTTVTPGAGTAAGAVTVTAGGLDSKVGVSGNVPAVNLRDLGVGSYSVEATFAPTDTTYFRGSSTTAPSTLTVVKTRSRMAVTLRGKTPRRPTRARVDLSGVHGTSPTGRVKFVVRSVRGPFTKKFRAKLLDGGDAVGQLGRLATGRYRMKIVYRGDNEHLRAVNTRTFRVRR